MHNVQGIISELEQRREAIERALAALGEIRGISAAAVPKRRGRPPGSRKDEGNKSTRSAKGHGLTAAGRKRLSDSMKARWAAKNAPKAVVKKKQTT